MTGGVLAFGSAGQIVYPQIFALGLATGGYLTAYIAIAVPAALIATVLFRPERAAA